MKKILFVCTGNTCRSPMAEALMNNLIRNNPGLENEFQVSSAGISAFTGDDASTNSKNVLNATWAIDISSHRATRLSRYLVQESDLILTMTQKHKKTILKDYPKSSKITFSLKEYVYNKEEDIVDPYGQSEEIYRKCAFEIKDALDILLEKLKNNSINLASHI